MQGLMLLAVIPSLFPFLPLLTCHEENLLPS